jgi:hypothetical protein
MNYLDRLRSFYAGANLLAASTEAFFRDMRSRYRDELGQRGIPFELLF